MKNAKCTSFGQSLIQQLGDNCIQNFHLGRCIVGFMVGNFVLPTIYLPK